MIIGVGVDIIEIARIKRAAVRQGFLNRYFTERERELFTALSPAGAAQSAATNFACKEAAAKALGTGFTGFGPRDIEVLRGANGEPVVVLHGGAAARLAELGGGAGTKIHASLTHTRELAAAVVIIEVL